MIIHFSKYNIKDWLYFICIVLISFWNNNIYGQEHTISKKDCDPEQRIIATKCFNEYFNFMNSLDLKDSFGRKELLKFESFFIPGAKVFNDLKIKGTEIHLQEYMAEMLSMKKNNIKIYTTIDYNFYYNKYYDPKYRLEIPREKEVYGCDCEFQLLYKKTIEGGLDEKNKQYSIDKSRDIYLRFIIETDKENKIGYIKSIKEVKEKDLK